MAKRKRRQSKTTVHKSNLLHALNVHGENSYDVDIVIPVYGNLSLLEKCVTSIKETCADIDYRLTIVDDYSPEDEQKSLNQYYQKLINNGVAIIKHSENSGYPRAVNTAVNSGNGKYVFVVNSDIELKENCIQEMLNVLRGDIPVENSPIDSELNKPIGVVGAKLIFPDDSKWKVFGGETSGGTIQHAGMHVSINRHPMHTYIGWPINHPNVNTLKRVQFVTGALIGFDRAVYDTILKAYKSYGDPTTGAFNEIYGRGTYEDIEFCVLARNFGYSVAYVPMAEAYHAVGQSVRLSQKNGTGGYDLDRNHNLFLVRLMEYILWDEMIVTDVPDEVVDDFLKAQVETKA